MFLKSGAKKKAPPKCVLQEQHSKNLKMKKQQSPTWVLLPIMLFAIFLRAVVSTYPYSGFNKPPMHGDYEAQRHWMEITINLPVQEWYFNTTNNDLLYWGLDYPPLTAYLSYAFGKVGQFLEPASMALFTSRGYETPTSKLFMRSTVLISDLLIYFTAVYLFVSYYYKDNTKRIMSLLLILAQPALILIDNGHFQYNSISLGLAVWAIYMLLKDRIILGSIFFCLSLNYKQMSLYYAPAFFFYLLGKSFRKNSFAGAVSNIVLLGITVIVTFAICWAPFLYYGTDVSLQVLNRLFPFNRGLFEDKVANFWCSVSPFLKVKAMEPSKVMLYSLGLTLLGLLPSGLYTMIYPTKQRFLYTLATTALSFFMFSYQVHEKSVLLPLLPVTLLTLDTPYISILFNIIANFSMYPLLYKDGAQIPYVVLNSLFLLLSLPSVRGRIRLLLVVSILGALGCHVLYGHFVPPANYPDIFVLLITTYSFGHFFLIFLKLNYDVFTLPKTDVESKLKLQ